jgi:hypothetical protein
MYMRLYDHFIGIAVIGVWLVQAWPWVFPPPAATLQTPVSPGDSAAAWADRANTEPGYSLGENGMSTGDDASVDLETRLRAFTGRLADLDVKEARVDQALASLARTVSFLETELAAVRKTKPAGLTHDLADPVMARELESRLMDEPAALVSETTIAESVVASLRENPSADLQFHDVQCSAILCRMEIVLDPSLVGVDPLVALEERLPLEGIESITTDPYDPERLIVFLYNG